MTPGVRRGQSIPGFITQFPGERRNRLRTEVPGNMKIAGSIPSTEATEARYAS